VARAAGVLVDGSTITMPSRRRIKRTNTQAPGCGLPIARVLVMLSLAVGTVIEVAIGHCKRKQAGENSLFRRPADGVA